MQVARKPREQTVKSRLRKIIRVPTAALLVLWLVASGYLFYGAASMYAVSKVTDEVLVPASLALVAVMDERSATVTYIAESDQEHKKAMLETRQQSDKALDKALAAFEPFLPLLPESVQSRLNDLESQFNEIDRIRAQVDADNASRAEALDYYNTLTEAGADLFDEQSRAIPLNSAVGPAISATSMFRAVDHLARADAMLTRAFAGGELSSADQQDFTRHMGAFRGQVAALSGYMGPEQQRTLEELHDSAEYARMMELREEISGRRIPVTTDPVTGEQTGDTSMPVDEEEWRESYGPVKEQFTAIGANQAGYSSDLLASAATRSILVAVLGSLGVAAVIVLAASYSLKAARILVARLKLLRDETQELSDRRLPSIMERLRQHKPVDVASEVPDLHQSEDEIGQVARSFNAAQRTAVRAAVQQSELRDGVNKVFLNIAHRNQTLVHRQLKLLDQMERDQEDPEQLTELFKLDHLATRSRRNAENLLILGGESPGRSWNRPIPLVDVLRSAISESGDYTRIKRMQIAPVALNGPAVADVIHLVAELVDNATSFSPPHTQVHLLSEQVPNGVTVEIEDRGLGMPEDELASANTLLGNPPEFDVMRLHEKTRLGLFVVSRLAQRHGIRVELRGSPYGGVQAIALLPAAIIAADAPALGGASGDDGGGDDSEQAPVETAQQWPRARTAPEPQNGTGGDMLAAPLHVIDRGAPSPPVSEVVPVVQAAPEAWSAEKSLEDAPAPETPNERTPDGRPKLPKRRPQANLAPQLHESTLAEAKTESGGTQAQQDGTERSLKVRQNLSAFQRGTQQGRHADKATQETDSTPKDGDRDE